MNGPNSLLREAVLRTNPFFPFSRLNREPYRLAIRAYLRLCRKFPEIRGVYIRHGMAGAGWVPGLSDIDLTVTFSPDLREADEFRFLTAFAEERAALRRWFPMLTDVVMLNEAHLPAWTRHGIRGQEARRWQALYGPPPACEYRDEDAAYDQKEDALIRYFEYLLPWYFEPLSYVGLRRMQRVASRILRHAPANVESFRNPTNDPALLVARVLLALDQWIGAAPGTHEQSVTVHRDTFFLIPGGRPNEDSLRQSLLQARNYHADGNTVRIATGSVARYWFRVIKPHQHHDWTAESTVLHGSHLMIGIEPPDERSCARSLLQSVSAVLDFPQLEKVVAQKRPEWFAEDGYRSLFERGCYLRLLLEHGFQSPQHARTMREAERCYPSEMRELAEIRSLAMAGNGALTDLRYRAFCLLRRNASAVNAAMGESLAACN